MHSYSFVQLKHINIGHATYDINSGGTRGHPDKGAAFPDGAETAKAESGYGVLGEEQAAPHHHIREYFLQYLGG